MPSTKTGIVTMEAMPHSKYHPTYFCTFVPAPIRRLQSRHVFCVAALLGGCSRPHVLPFHSLSVCLTLPFDEGPHFPCSRSREMESSCRCCDGMVAWGDRPLPSPVTSPRLLPPALAPSSSNSLPGQQQRQRRFQCARQNKREYGGRLPTICRSAGSNTSEVPRGTPCGAAVAEVHSNPTPAARTSPLWILLGLAFPLARTPTQRAHGPGGPSQPNPTSWQLTDLSPAAD